jgi:hypothetical protein
VTHPEKFCTTEKPKCLCGNCNTKPVPQRLVLCARDAPTTCCRSCTNYLLPLLHHLLATAPAPTCDSSGPAVCSSVAIQYLNAILKLGKQEEEADSAIPHPHISTQQLMQASTNTILTLLCMLSCTKALRSVWSPVSKAYWAGQSKTLDSTYACYLHLSQRRLRVEEKHSMRSRNRIDTIDCGLTQHQTHPQHLVHTLAPLNSRA